MRPELRAHSLVICLMCLICWPLLCCLPAFTDKSYRYFHTCSNSNNLVAIRTQNGGIEVKERPLPKAVPSKYGAARDQSEAESVVADQRPTPQK